MKFVHCNIEGFQRKRYGKKIVCFGASQKLIEAVDSLKIEEDIEAIIDNSTDKQGTTIILNGKKHIIHSFVEVINIFPGHNDWIVLITSRFYEQILEQLNSVSELAEVECYAFPCMQLYIDKKKDDVLYKRLIEPCLYTYDEILTYQGVPLEKREELVADKKKELVTSMDGHHRLVIPRVVFSHWNKCNLNCEHCGAFMPDVEIPYHIPSVQVLKDVDLFLRSVDECLMVDITDGEPFLNPELDLLINGLTSNEKIKCVFFYTNATCMPKEEVLKALQHPKVMVMVSDYGFLEPMAKMIGTFEKRGIHFQVMSDSLWMNTDSMENRGRSGEFLKYHFLNCEAGRTRKRMAYGKLWTCTRSFRFHTLNLYESENDYVELKESDSDDELREKILKLYLADTADACNYCDYGNMAAEMVKAGIQKNSKMKKSEYTIISREELEELKRGK